MIPLAILSVCCTAVFRLAYAFTHPQCSAEELPSRAVGGKGVLLQTRHSKTSTSNVQDLSRDLEALTVSHSSHNDSSRASRDPKHDDTADASLFQGGSASDTQFRMGAGDAIPSFSDTSLMESQGASQPSNSARTAVDQAYHAMASNGCKGTGALFIHFGLGSHGGESLNEYFRSENFSTLFWQPYVSMLRDDLRAGDDHLPSIQRAVAEAKQENACGNVFLGDIKPQLNRAWANITYQQLFRSLEIAFPDAVWIWLIRHPDKWATSLTHWSRIRNRKEAHERLQKWRREHALFHCRAWQHFGSRLQSNGKGDAVQLNLEQLDWPLFLKQLQDASGYQGLSSENGMPHKNHHEPSWTFSVPDTTNWNSSKYLTEACELVAGDEA